MVRRTFLFATAYAVAIALGRATILPETGLAVLWPAAGVGVLWMLRTRTRGERALVVVLLGFASAVGNLVTGMPAPGAVVFGLANVVVSGGTWALFVGRIWLRPGGRGSEDGELRRLADSTRLLAAGLVATSVSAVLGAVGALLAGHELSWATGIGFVLRNLAAVVVIAGPGLTVVGRRHRVGVTTAAEAALVYVATLVTVFLVFGTEQRLPLSFLPLAVVVWAGLRLPLPLAAAQGVLVSVTSLAFVCGAGGGAFGVIEEPTTRGLVLQAYMMMATFLAMTLATVHAELRDLLERVTSAARRAERLIADAPHGVVLLDLAGVVVEANPAMAAMVGWPAASIVGRHCSTLTGSSKEDVDAYLAAVLAADGAMVRGDWDLEVPGGEQVHVSTSSRLVAGTDAPAQILVNVVDVSERRRYEERLAYLAHHDALTGLPNRRRFEELLAQHQSLCARYGPRGALLLIDLDHFKEVNDTLGHAAGDDLIVTAGAVLAGSLRASDTVARIGGDEFAVLLPEADRSDADAVADLLVARVREHCADAGGVVGEVTASIGVATFEAADAVHGDVLALADMLMYAAKDAGRDRYAGLDPQAPPRTRRSAPDAA